MELTYNDQKKIFVFRTGRVEKDDQGVLGMALASRARFKIIEFNAERAIYFSRDPIAALKLSRFAPSSLREQLRKGASGVSGQIAVLTYKEGVYIWDAPKVSLDGRTNYKALAAGAGFAPCPNPEATLPRGAGQGIKRLVWYTEKSAKALALVEYADDAAAAALGQFLGKRKNAIAGSRATESDIEIKAPEGKTPFPYQKAGVAYAMPRTRVLFGDEMGLGKTIQAILWWNMQLAEEAKRMLIICPASLKRNWARELEAWLVRPATIGIADGQYAQVIPATDIVIINYELLHRKVDTGQRKVDPKTGQIKTVWDYVLREGLRSLWDMLVIDEAHKLKGDPEDVIRVRMAFAIQARRECWLTGTPMVNKVRELWNVVHRLAPKQFPSKREYLNRFCKGGTYHDPYAGGQNLAELQQRMRTYFMVRRLKRDVLTELPPKLRQVIELPAVGGAALVKQETLAFSKKQEALTKQRLVVELSKASDNEGEYKRAVKSLTESIRVAFEELSRIRKEMAIARIPAVIEHVAQILEEGHKVILFAHHSEVINKLHDHFKKESVYMHGGVSTADRQKAVDSFQTDDNVRLIIGSIGTMGVGWTLVASSFVVLAELDWVPGAVTQAEDRAHRIGQKDSVLVQHLVLENSLDKRMAEVLIDKQSMADAALDTESAEMILSDPVTPDREEVATQRISPAVVTRTAESLSESDIKNIHICFKALAGLIPESALLEGETFREVDEPLGKVLAEHAALTPRLAALGKHFLNRYRSTKLETLPEFQILFTKG